MLLTFLTHECGWPYGAAHFLRAALSRAKEALVETGSLKEYARALVGGDLDALFFGPTVNLTSLLSLVAAVLHFYETAPDLAAWSAVGVDLFFEVSRLQPLTLSKRVMAAERAALEASMAEVKLKQKGNDKKKKGKGKRRK